jgi:hypothetical protein
MYWVFSDPEFERAIDEYKKYNYLAQERRENLKLIGRKFDILSLDVLAYVSRGKDALNGYRHRMGLWQYNKNHDTYKIIINNATTLKEYKKLWDEIQYFKNIELKLANTKLKPPADTKLIYAVFKARKNRLTFSKIFLLYQGGELPYYVNGNTNQFKSVESLSRHYRKYKPIEQMLKTYRPVK